MQIWPLAVPLRLAVRADRPVPDRAAAGRFLTLGHNGILGRMTSQSTELLPLCACGCGERVKTPGAEFKRGHFHRGRADGPRLEPIPGPEDEVSDDELFDLGEP